MMSADGAGKPTNHDSTAESAPHGSSPADGGKTALVAEAGTALTVTESPNAEDPGRDMRLDRLPMQMDVMVRVNGMRVRDLLALEKGTVLTTVHEHTQDVPVESGGALLVWGEFEVLDQKLAVRITRLA